MKQLTFILAFLLATMVAGAQAQSFGYKDYSFAQQVNIGKGSGAPSTSASAWLEIGPATNNSTKGLLIPRGDRTAVVSPVMGLLFYDVNDKKLFQFDGLAWVDVGSGTSGGSNTFSSEFSVVGSAVSLNYANGHTASSSQKGFLSAADWTIFNNKQSALTFQYSMNNAAGAVNLVGDVASPGANKVYGTDASGNRTWKADPAGGSSNTFSGEFSVVGSAVSLNYTGGQAASGSAKGFLTAADWTAFNNKQSALTFQHSLNNSSGAVNLVGDVATPGANMTYGTDGSGNRVWKADPAGGGGSLSGGVNTRLMVWTGSSTHTNYANLTYDGTKLTAGKFYLTDPTDNGGDDGSILIARNLIGSNNAHSIRVHDVFNRPGMSHGVFDDATDIYSWDGGSANHHASYQARPIYYGTGTLSEVISVSSSATINSGRVERVSALDVGPIGGTGELGTRYGLYVFDQLRGEHVRPIYVGTQTGSTDVYSLHSATFKLNHGALWVGTSTPITIDGTDPGTTYTKGISYNVDPVTEKTIAADQTHRIQPTNNGWEFRHAGSATANLQLVDADWKTVFITSYTGLTSNVQFLQKEITAPATPGSGYGTTWVDPTDHKLKFKNSLGTLYDLTATGAPTITNDANTRVATLMGDGSFNGEQYLTFDRAGRLKVGKASGLFRLLQLGNYGTAGVVENSGEFFLGNGWEAAGTPNEIIKRGTDAGGGIGIGVTGFSVYTNMTGTDGITYLTLGAQPKRFAVNNSGDIFHGTATAYSMGQVITSDATQTTIKTVTLPSNSGGEIEISIVGMNGTTESITGHRIYAYRNDGGTTTLTALSSPTDIVEGSLSGSASWTVANSSGNCAIKVTGKAATTIYWQATITLIPYAPPF